MSLQQSPGYEDIDLHDIESQLIPFKKNISGNFSGNISFFRQSTRERYNTICTIVKVPTLLPKALRRGSMLPTLEHSRLLLVVKGAAAFAESFAAWLNAADTRTFESFVSCKRCRLFCRKLCGEAQWRRLLSLNLPPVCQAILTLYAKTLRTLTYLGIE